MGYLPSRSTAVLGALVLALMSACAGGSGGAAQTSRPASPTPASPAPAASPSSHLFLIVMENHSYSVAIRQAYTAELGARYGVAADYHAVAHPSLPNYLALTSGSTWDVEDDGYHRLPAGGLGTQLTEVGVSWRAYMEGMGANCLVSQGRYAVKHNPFAYYGGTCPPNVVPLTSLQPDLAAGPPRFVWITPDLCHDGHDCGAAAGDDFLRQLVPSILATAAWQHGGRLLITWDEDDGGADNQVLTLVIQPRPAAHLSDRRYDHYSLLASVEDSFGLPRLGQAGQASPLTDLTG